MAEDTVAEKRHFQRILYSAEAMLYGNDITLPCRLVDISLKGCLLEFDEPWPNGTTGLYNLRLSLSDDISIGMTLRFIHRNDMLIGFRCEHIDIDSITNLRRLVELNLGDSEILSRELTALTDL